MRIYHIFHVLSTIEIRKYLLPTFDYLIIAVYERQTWNLVLIFYISFTGEVYLGSFNKLTYHPVQGDLYLKDAQTLVIRNFVYDGEGPDAFFVVGKRPMRRNRVVIRDRRDAIPIPYESQYPYPPYSAYSRQATSNQGGSYLNQRLRYDDPDIPVLGRFEGQDIELNMPEGVDAEKIRWISLYCRQFNMDFGHVMIDDNPWGRPRTSWTIHYSNIPIYIHSKMIHSTIY